MSFFHLEPTFTPVTDSGRSTSTRGISSSFSRLATCDFPPRQKKTGPEFLLEDDDKDEEEDEEEEDDEEEDDYYHYYYSNSATSKCWLTCTYQHETSGQSLNKLQTQGGFTAYLHHHFLRGNSKTAVKAQLNSTFSTWPLKTGCRNPKKGCSLPIIHFQGG